MIEIVKVADRVAGNLKAHDLLKEMVDKTTLLALSGGTSPNYRKMIVEPADILPGASCMEDERFGMPFHDDSNELIIRHSGLIDFFEIREIKFYKILEAAGIEETAKDYNQTVANLFGQFSKRVAVVGVGENLHTAGIFPDAVSLKSPDWVVAETVEDRLSKRITLTLKALGQFNSFVILIFGDSKKDALKIILSETENDMQKYPAIFYRKCAARCYLITDIEVNL